MKTDVITIHSDLTGQKEAMQEAENFTRYLHLTGRNAMHVRLLAEEAISLVHGIIKDFKGNFWLESEPSDKGTLCRICVSADTDVSDGEEEKLLDVSTSGRNEEARGIMGKIRQVLRWSVQHTDDEDAVRQEWFDRGANFAPSPYAIGYYWSLTSYRDNVRQDASAQAERDELEKSIIARLSDEVKVGIRSGRAEVVIERLFPEVK